LRRFARQSVSGRRRRREKNRRRVGTKALVKSWLGLARRGDAAILLSTLDGWLQFHVAPYSERLPEVWG